MIHSTGERKPNDPKLSDGRGWRDRCMAGGKGAAEAAGVTAALVRCSAWLGVSFIAQLRNVTKEGLENEWKKGWEYRGRIG